jgi:hypothetical protein
MLTEDSPAAMPSPPPPYSPETPDQAGTPHATRPSPMVEQIGFVSSPLASEPSNSIMPSTTIARHSPQHPRSPAFPPPPGQSTRNRERSASGQRLLNTIHSLTGRGKQPASHEVQSSQSVHYPSASENPRALLLHIRLWLRRTQVGVHQRVLVGTQACLYQDRHLVHLHQVHDRKV